MQERNNLIYILERTKQAVRHQDIILIKELSNKTVHSASIYSDSDNITVAVVVYAISKILERKKYHSYKEWPGFFRAIIDGLDKAVDALKHNNTAKFKDALKEIRKSITRTSGHLRSYIEDVFRKAQINKASRIYEHGVSMQHTSEMLGITIFELAEYAGKTGISDVDLSITLNVKERINIAEGIFR